MRAAVATMLLVAALPAAAAVPTAAQARDVERLFGFDTMLGIVVQHTTASIAEPTMTQAQKGCIASAIGASIEQRLLTTLATSFVSGDNVEAWKSFNDTAGGRRMIDIVRRSLLAVANETPRPELKTELATFTTEEQHDVAAFMQTPAAEVLQHGLASGLKPTDAEATALRAQIAATCGLQQR